MKKFSFLIIPFVSVAICSLLLFSSLDSKVADFFQRPLKSTEQSPEVLMINVDDDAVAQIGNWPFSRDVYTQMLRNLKDLGAQTVVFDLSFLDKSQASVDERYVRERLPGYIDDYFSSLSEAVYDYLGSYEEGWIELDEIAEGLVTELKRTEINLNTSISHVINPVDEGFAAAIKDFGNTYLTLTFDDNFEISPETLDYLENYIALDNIVGEKDTITKTFEGVEPALFDFLSQAKAAGFVNADPDKDGYLRRVHLVVKYNGKYYAQLVFRPILERLGNPQVVVTNKYIQAGDLKIPRAEDGSVLVKYPKCSYVDYNSISLANIYFISTMEETFLRNLNIMNENGFFDDYDEEENPYSLNESAAYIQDELKNGERPEEEITYENYLYYRKLYMKAAEAVLTEDVEQYWAEVYEEDADYIHELFGETRTAFNKFYEAYEKYSEKVNNAICIIGTNATSTSDYGLNQYEEHYPNPGLHYTVANMLLSKDFVDDSNPLISIIFALVMSLLYCCVSHRLKGTTRQIVAGIISVILTAGLLFAYFLVTRTYIGAVVPVVSVFLAYVVMTITGFLTASHDKKFITNAFSQCLSKEVVDEIVANPSSFKLGGQNVLMTAMFTDIQKFSSFSELLSAAELVALLNYYLTKMSDIIMEERGTVDKYEGDAIIALVGAPVKMEDHAQRACAAAIKMKAAEAEMNRNIIQIAANEKPEDMERDLYNAFKIMVANNKQIFTRIGLNSGEMVAGYMGSENKKNYTMMGNNVNLASRLEGVNKQYSTNGILISESTRQLLGDRFVVRSLDRVRVVNVNTPIRLYELICEKADADEKLLKYYDNWEIALKNFENKQYETALEQFKKLLDYKKDDKVAAYYVKLTENFFVKGKYPSAADDIGVEYQPEDNVFKLLSK